MKNEQVKYIETGRSIAGAQESQMFGKPCFKTGGKAFISFFNDSMVFKLGGEQHKKALALPGAVLFDPSGKNRPMKEWIQLPPETMDEWPEYAAAAFDYVRGKNS